MSVNEHEQRRLNRLCVFAVVAVSGGFAVCLGLPWFGVLGLVVAGLAVYEGAAYRHRKNGRT